LSPAPSLTEITKLNSRRGAGYPDTCQPSPRKRGRAIHAVNRAYVRERTKPGDVVGTDSCPLSERPDTRPKRGVSSNFAPEPTERLGSPRGQEHFAQHGGAPPLEHAASFSRAFGAPPPRGTKSSQTLQWRPRLRQPCPCHAEDRLRLIQGLSCAGLGDPESAGSRLPGVGLGRLGRDREPNYHLY